MQAVILAAGLGTRLKPVTDSRSKAMVPLLGRPLVERALMPFVENGIDDFVFVVSPEDQAIRRYFTKHGPLRIKPEFVNQNERLGMAHALGLAAPLIGGRFVLSACDSLISSSHVHDLLKSTAASDAVLSLLDVEPEMVSKSGVVELDGDLVRRIVEKPTLEEAPSQTVSLPHYIFSNEILDFVAQVEPSPRGEYELQDAIQALIDGGGRVTGVRATGRIQVSTPEDLLQLTRRLLTEGSDLKHLGPDQVGNGSTLIDPVWVDPGVVIGDGCEIGPEVYLESGCAIGDGAAVRRSVILRGACVRENEVIEDRVVV